MSKTSVKFQKNRHKTVGGVAHTRYIVLKGGGEDGRKAKNYVPPLFFEKAEGNKIYPLYIRWQLDKGNWCVSEITSRTFARH